MIRFVLLDIEGTTTDIDFVHKVLFPYSAERMADFVREHETEPDVRAALELVRETVREEDNRPSALDTEAAIETLLRWIREDRKHTALKSLQGLVWQQGFETGAYQGHVYDEVPGCLRTWHHQGLGLGIYSSGSVHAQKLLFGHSVAGDLTGLFTRYFDTRIGAKKEVDSYRNIAAALNLPPESILFLSDVEAELDAAREAGFQAALVNRGGISIQSKYPVVSSFTALSLDGLSASAR